MSMPEHPNKRGIDRTTATALDIFDVPPPSDSFVARMLAIADLSPSVDHMLPAMPRWKARLERGRRGPWMRRTAIGLIAAGLASATAAAAGIFDAVQFDMPVIARMLAQAAPPPKVAKAVRAKPKAAPRPVAVADAASPGADQVSVAPGLLTPAERVERFRALPLPVRAVVTERMVTRTQRRLAARGIFVPRNIVRERVAARTGQMDLPQGSGIERRAQMRAALMTAPPGSLPPRLERVRERLLSQQSNAPAPPQIAATAESDATIDSRNQQARQAWRDLRRDQMLRRQARWGQLASPARQADAAPAAPTQPGIPPAEAPPSPADGAPPTPKPQASE